MVRAFGPLNLVLDILIEQASLESGFASDLHSFWRIFRRFCITISFYVHFAKQRYWHAQQRYGQPVSTLGASRTDTQSQPQ